MDRKDNNNEGKTMKTKLFLTPEAKLIETQKRAEVFAKEKEAFNTCRELIQCTVLTQIIYGNGHWRLAQAMAHLAYSYLMLRGLSIQAMHHANSAKYIIFMWKGSAEASLEERGGILSTLVTIYYTLGVANMMQKNSKDSLLNLQNAKRIMEELKGTDCGSTPELKISERDLLVAFGRATLQNKKLELATRHFEKAINATISAEGEVAPELINLYQEIAQIEQARKNYDKSIRYLLQAHLISVSLHTKFSVETALAALLLGKAYASAGEEKHVEAAELYFNESLTAYKEVLGMDHPQTINALKELSKWLACKGKRKQAYDLLKESFKSQQDLCSDFNEKAAERLYIMGCICLVEKEIRKAYQLLSKCVEIQTAIYGPRHKKTKKIQQLLDMLEMVPAVHEGIRCMKKKESELHCKIPDL